MMQWQQQGLQGFLTNGTMDEEHLALLLTRSQLARELEEDERNFSIWDDDLESEEGGEMYDIREDADLFADAWLDAGPIGSWFGD